MKKKELIYLAGALEYRGNLIQMKSGNFMLSFRAPGKLPKRLKKLFGGTCFSTGKHLWWYRVQGDQAKVLLKALFPHLIIWREKAENLLTRK
jgi:hypothetical protein